MTEMTIEQIEAELDEHREALPGLEAKLIEYAEVPPEEINEDLIKELSTFVDDLHERQVRVEFLKAEAARLEES